MEQVIEIMQIFVHNRLLMSAVLAWMTAQLLKTGINILMTKEFHAERLVGAGGMPSSHSSTVCALTTSACLLYGVDSSEFAICFVLGMIVMYDALGVRRETGKQARLLNLMIRTFSPEYKELPKELLKEYIGHTPLQVICGAILGVIIGIIWCSRGNI